jgi:hypothetical protein
LDFYQPVIIDLSTKNSLLLQKKEKKGKICNAPLTCPARWAGRVPTTKVLVAHGAKKLARKKLRVSVDGGYLAH